MLNPALERADLAANVGLLADTVDSFCDDCWSGARRLRTKRQQRTCDRMIARKARYSAPQQVKYCNERETSLPLMF